MRKKINSSKFIILFVLFFGLVSFVPVTSAVNLQAIQSSAHFGGQIYSVKVYAHSDSSTYYLVGSESGFQIYDNEDPPVWQDDFPTCPTAYTGGASGLGITNFRTGLDAAFIGSKDYAFYADGQDLYALDISTPAALSSTAADSVTIANVRAVKVAQINSYWYAFALAYQSGAPGTTMLYILDIDDPANMTTLQTIDLDKDSGNPNNNGGCDLEFIADLDGNGTEDDPYLFIADGTEGIKAVDLSDLYPDAGGTLPDTGDVTATDTYGTATGIDAAWFGGTLYAFVADGSEGLKIFDITNPANMPADYAWKGYVELPHSGNAYDIKLFGTTAFVANGADGVRVVDVSDPANPADVTEGENDLLAGLSYIDSTDIYNRLNGTAYSLDFDFTTAAPHNASYPGLKVIVSWGEAGLIKTDINLSAVPDKGPTGVLGAAVSNAIYAGGYIWLFHQTTGKISRITPGGDTTGADCVTTDAQVFYLGAYGNIVSDGTYIYGIDKTDQTKLARFAISNFSGTVADMTITESNTAVDEYGEASVILSITNLFTDGANIFFLVGDVGVAAPIHDDSRVWRVDLTATFGNAAATDLVESAGGVFADRNVSARLVSDGSYIYGMTAKKATGTLSFTLQPVINDTVTIGADTYEFDGVGANINVTIAGTKDATIDNLYAAINTSGTEPVSAISKVVNTSLTVAADVGGAYGNTIGTTESTVTVRLQWGAGTLGSGGDPDGHVTRIAVGFDGATSATESYESLTGTVDDLFAGPNGSYVVVVGNDEKIGRLVIDAGFSSAGDIKESANTPFFVDALCPLLIIGDYLYGAEFAAGPVSTAYLTRVQINWNDGVAAAATQSGVACSGNIKALAGGSDREIYVINDTDGRVHKYFTSLATGWGATSPDAIGTAGTPIKPNGTFLVVAGNYVFAEDTVADTVAMVGFVGAEGDHSIAVNNTPHFAGYAKDIALYVDETDGNPDQAYVADGKKGIIRFTVTDPTDIAAWAPVILTDTTAAANGDVTDPEDIQDARGIDVTPNNSLVLVADGTAGVKLVVPAVTGLQSQGGIADGDGYMTQAWDDADADTDAELGNGTAEDIKYFEFNSHEYAAVANGSAGVAILDLDDNVNGTLGDMAGVALVDTDGYAYSVAVDTENNHVYVADGSGGLKIIDLDPQDTGNDLSSAQLLSGGTYTIGSSYNLRSVILDNPGHPSYAYLAYGSKGVIILEITDPTNPSVTDTYPRTGLVDGEAFDLAYVSNCLYVAMSYGAILALDIIDPDNIGLKGGLDIYGKALGLAYGDVDGPPDVGAIVPHLFIANGPGGFLTASIKTQPYVITVIPNIQPVGGGDIIKVIGSGFEDPDLIPPGMTIDVFNDDGSETISAYSYISEFEFTFTAPASPTGLPGQFDVKVISSRGVSNSLSDAIEYLPEGKPIVLMSADEAGQGLASPGGLVPINLILHSNGAGEVTSVTARIKYNVTQFEVLTNEGGNVDSSVFDLNDNLEKIVYMMITDSDPSDDYKTLNIIIYSEDTGVNTPIPDGSNLGTVYLTVLKENPTDITLTLDSSSKSGVIQQVSTSLGDYVTAYGSAINIYVKPAPQMTFNVAAYTDNTNMAGYSGTFGDYEVTVSESLDLSAYIENGEITFSVPANALASANDPNISAVDAFTISKGTLSAGNDCSITVLTDSSGQAAVTLNVGTVAGDYTMTISGEYNGSTISGSPTTPIYADFTITAENTPNNPDDSITLSYTPESPTTGGTVAITATAYDKYGNLLSGETVTFSTDQGTLSSLTGVTDSNGRATVQLNLENAVIDHTITARYDTATTATMIIAPAGPDVNGDGVWESSSDIQTAINYHLNWTDLSTAPKTEGKIYVPGDTNQNNRFDLNEVIAIINLALGI